MMKAFIYALITTAFLCACGKKSPNRVDLFNGKDLTGWISITNPDDSIPADDTFTASDGIIHISGQPFGYMRTTETFKDYTLYLEYRWAGNEKADGGIFNRLQGEDHVWPRDAVQFQMRPDDYGYIFSGYPVDGIDGQGLYKKPNINTEDPERPIGEWNNVEISCKGKQITIKVNGTLVNEANIDATEGHIGMQSEGGPIDIRNIYIIPE